MKAAAGAWRRLAAAWAVTLAAGAGVLAPAAHAGRNCEAQALTVSALQRGMDLAQRTQQALQSSGAQVVLLARAGQDLSRFGLSWSHMGFAYREADGTWRLLHKLNTCGQASADVYRQGLGEFFMDDPFRYEAAFIVPTEEVQSRLMALLRDTRRATLLHTPRYSMVAYPWSNSYQQSNQWVLETLAMAMEPDIVSRSRAQSWLQFKGYEPTVLKLGPLERLGARMTRANIAFDDHPNDKRYSDRIETVTADSVFDWLQRSALAGPLQQVR